MVPAVSLAWHLLPIGQTINVVVVVTAMLTGCLYPEKLIVFFQFLPRWSCDVARNRS